MNNYTWCSDRAMEVAANVMALRQLIAELMTKQEQLEGSINQTNSLVNETGDTLEQVRFVLYMYNSFSVAPNKII